MKASPLGFVSVLASLVLSPAAVAQEMPRFNIEAICASAQPLTPDDRNPVATCMNDERAAERQLQTTWIASSPPHRETCAAETRIGGSPSYVDVLTCLQMYQSGTGSVSPRRPNARERLETRGAI